MDDMEERMAVKWETRGACGGGREGQQREGERLKDL